MVEHFKCLWVHLSQIALHRYGDSPQWISLIQTCYEGISIESFFQSATTSWHIDINREFLLAALFL